MSRRWLLRVASEASESAKETAKRILDSDLTQFVMVLTTIVAAVVYGWIEGYALVVAQYGSEQWLATQNLWFLGHLSTYSLAMLILFACITGGFALIKSHSMFAKGRRYFLFTFVGNYPFSWLVEDFAYFFFQPQARLESSSWTNWFLGGIYVLDPWRAGVKLWIPTWYLIIGLFWLAMMWIAHRCTVYDNLIKDQIAREILPETIRIPQVEVKKSELETVAPRVERVPLPRAETEAPRTPDTAPPKPDIKIETTPEAKPKTRSPEAEQALRKLREKWIRNHA
jgi:hypothetical protein